LNSSQRDLSRRSTLAALGTGLLGAALGSAAVPAAAQQAAQDWPQRPVRLVVPYPAGGGVDVLARAVALRLQERWGQPVTVDNRPGANTLVGTEIVARANDGHTLLFTTDATFTINPHLYGKLPYDPERDFAPINRLVSFSQLLVASASLPANTLGELVKYARTNPGKLSYASYGPGSQPQLATEILKQKAGIFILHVPYRGIPQAVGAVVGGEVPLTWAGIPSARPHLASRRIKALAYGGKTRAAAYPDVPTAAEQGFPEIDANVWVGLFAPAAMPQPLVDRISREVSAILREPEFKAREIDGKGYDLEAEGPEELRRHIRAELRSRAAPIRYSGAKAD
jgi:tripartite-type tricarboxylate transporter receptor subunit TctC